MKVDADGLTDVNFRVASSSTVFARCHVMTSSFQKFNLEQTWRHLPYHPSHITYPPGQIQTLPKDHLDLLLGNLTWQCKIPHAK